MPKPVAWRAGADERRKFRKNNFLAEVSEDGGLSGSERFVPRSGMRLLQRFFCIFEMSSVLPGKIYGFCLRSSLIRLFMVRLTRFFLFMNFPF